MVATFRFVITDASSSVLLAENGPGWALPRTTGTEPEIVIDVAPALRDLVGADVVVLRDLRVGSMPPADDSVVYVTEAIRDPSAARGRWWSRADGFDVVDARDRSTLEMWCEQDEPVSLRPWQREGWFANAVSWIEKMLPSVSEVRQFATWGNSSVLRVRTRHERAWFKATIPYFASEPVVTAMLGELLPGRVPDVLGLDAARGWVLLEDLGDEPVDTLPVGERLGGLLAVGELHRASIGLIDALLDGGCLDRRPQVLSEQIGALAADRTIALPEGLADRLEAAAPRLQELCAQMASSPIPPTLVHGDLHGGNIMRTAGRYVAFDWSDACVADPFVDVLMFLTRLPDGSNLRTMFRGRYLEAWPGVTPVEAEAYAELAEPLAAMHHAVTYRGLRDAFGDDWWLFQGALPRWLEHALACRIVGGSSLRS